MYNLRASPEFSGLLIATMDNTVAGRMILERPGTWSEKKFERAPSKTVFIFSEGFTFGMVRGGASFQLHVFAGSYLELTD